jgi:hypothetical protein
MGQKHTSPSNQINSLDDSQIIKFNPKDEENQNNNKTLSYKIHPEKLMSPKQVIAILDSFKNHPLFS